MIRPLASLSQRLSPTARRTLACTLAAAAVLSAPPALAYSLIGKTWPNGDVVFRMNLGNFGEPLVPLQDGHTTWNAAASPALDMWSVVMQRIQLRPVTSSSGASSGDRVNSIVFSNNVFGQPFGNGTLAMTYYIMQGSSLVEADILFNRAASFDSYRGPLQFGSNGYALGDIRRVLLHELGHAIGLNHFDSVPAIMNTMVSSLATLSSDDIAGAQAMYGVPAPTPPPVSGSGRSDFNGDKKSDLLWQSTGGAVALWLMNGTTLSQAMVLTQQHPSWSVAGTGDLDGDGQSDIVWQHNSGWCTVWFMNGVALRENASLGWIDPSWKIVAVGDLDGDGKADLVWRGGDGAVVVWKMNGSTRTQTVGIGHFELAWKIAGAGDLDGDGKSDLLWQHPTGMRILWFMNGFSIKSTATHSVSPAWDILGSGDFNGDGKDDILFQDASGTTVVWLMNGATILEYIGLANVGPDWKLRNH